jgi:hypothetical protein
MVSSNPRRDFDDLMYAGVSTANPGEQLLESSLGREVVAVRLVREWRERYPSAEDIGCRLSESALIAI